MNHRLYNSDNFSYVSNVAIMSPSMRTTSVPDNVNKRPKKVLVIDDNDAITVTVTFILRSLGYKVLSASDGQEGLKIFKMESPDVILLDYDLPKLHGSEVLKKVREDAELGNTPVIMLTGNADEQIVKRLITMGVQNYILKPFEQQSLVAKVESVVGKAK